MSTATTPTQTPRGDAHGPSDTRTACAERCRRQGPPAVSRQAPANGLTVAPSGMTWVISRARVRPASPQRWFTTSRHTSFMCRHAGEAGEGALPVGRKACTDEDDDLPPVGRTVRPGVAWEDRRRRYQGSRRAPSVWRHCPRTSARGDEAPLEAPGPAMGWYRDAKKAFAELPRTVAFCLTAPRRPSWHVLAPGSPGRRKSFPPSTTVKSAMASPRCTHAAPGRWPTKTTPWRRR